LQVARQDRAPTPSKAPTSAMPPTASRRPWHAPRRPQRAGTTERRGRGRHCGPECWTSSRSTKSQYCSTPAGRCSAHWARPPLDLVRIIDAPGVTHVRYRVAS